MHNLTYMLTPMFFGFFYEQCFVKISPVQTLIQVTYACLIENLGLGKLKGFKKYCFETA